MRTFTLLTLLVLLHAATAQQCNTPILKDIISVSADKTSYTRGNIGDQASFITGLPLLDSSHPLIIRHSNPTFTRPLIDFIQTNRFSPNYWITAIDIQQGPAGSGCTSTAVIEDVTIELKVYRAYTGFSMPFKAGTNGGNSLPIYNWKVLGGTVGNGRTTRISFEPIRVDGVRFTILSLDPLTSSVEKEACMRVEIYGCEKSPGVSSAPSVNTGPLHQYNLIQASADTYGNLYTDSSYTGIASDGYQSGGTGILTDGTVGGNAETTPAQWLGWNRNETSKMEVVFLLKRDQQFDTVNLFYWEDGSNQVSAPVNVTLTDHMGNELTFDSPETIIQGEKLRVKRFTRSSPTQASYVKVSMAFKEGADFVLLSEVELVREDGINVLTEANATIVTSPPTTPPTTSPSPSPTTTTTTTNTTTATTTLEPTTTTPTETPVVDTTTPEAITTTMTTPTTTTETTTKSTTTTETTPTTTPSTTPSTSSTTTSDDVTTSTEGTTTDVTSTSQPELTGEPEFNSQLIAGLIFVLILVILLVLLVILLVVFFYYLRSKGKRVRDMACVGRMGGFRRIYGYGEADPESGTKKRFSKPKVFKRGTSKAGYETVNGKPLTKSEVPDSAIEAFNQGLEEPMSPELTHKEDLYIFAPKDAIYSTVDKGRKLNKTYEQSEFDLSLPSTPLDLDQEFKANLRPLSSIYEMPALLVREEEPLEFSWMDIVEKAFLGNGHFGEVCLATLTNYSAKEMGLGASGKKGIDIAIKKLARGSAQQTKDEFSKEVKFMARLDHPNVVKLLGVCLDETGGSRFLAMEYMVNGDLAQFLKDCDYVDSIGANLRIQEMNQDCMVYMGQQVAAGMEYLSDRNYIHRDLSARNCLVGYNYTIKVADFGMSQDLYSKEYFKITGRAILPIRWMPNESFYGKFTIKSDVWAFGVTLWEIFNKCEEKPYGDLTDHELIQDVLTNKNNRVKLVKPFFAPEQGWDLIGRCTDLNPDDRPNFSEVRRELEDMSKFQIEEVDI